MFVIRDRLYDHPVEEIVLPVGHRPELYKDVRPEKYIKNYVKDLFKTDIFRKIMIRH
jgi:hypothetical protein